MENQYFFPVGLFYSQVLSTQPFINGNTLSSTAQYIFLTRTELLDSDLLNGIAQYETYIPGLYSRYSLPKIENTSIDDYLSLGCIPRCAAKILSRGEKSWGFFDVTHKNVLKQWLWRFPGFKQHLKLCAVNKLNLFDCLVWSAAILAAAYKPVTNQDGWMQSHLMIEVYRRSSFRSAICDKAVLIWLKKKPATTSEIVARYIGDSGHPLVEAWKPYN